MKFSCIASCVFALSALTTSVAVFGQNREVLSFMQISVRTNRSGARLHSLKTDSAGGVWSAGRSFDRKLYFGEALLTDGLEPSKPVPEGRGFDFVTSFDANLSFRGALTLAGENVSDVHSIATINPDQTFMFGTIQGTNLGTFALTNLVSAFAATMSASGEVSSARFDFPGMAVTYRASAVDRFGNVYVIANRLVPLFLVEQPFADVTKVLAFRPDLARFWEKESILEQYEGFQGAPKRYGSTDPTSVTADDYGRVVFGGGYGGSLRFDDVPALPLYGGGFVVQVDAATGRHRWTRPVWEPDGRIIGPFHFLLTGDRTGNVYFVSTFTQLLPGGQFRIGDTVLQGFRGGGMLIAKLSPDGQVLWWTERGSILAPTAITYSPDGIVYVGGNYRGGGTTRPEDLPLPPHRSSNPLDGDVFVTALSAETGQWLWINAYGGEKNDQLVSTSADRAGNLWMGGTFGGTNAVFDSFRVSARGSQDIFLAKIPSGRSAVVAPAKSESGVFELSVLGDKGVTNRIEYSTDLRQWTLLTNFVSTNALSPLRDPAAASERQRFYRSKSN